MNRYHYSFPYSFSQLALSSPFQVLCSFLYNFPCQSWTCEWKWCTKKTSCKALLLEIWHTHLVFNFLCLLDYFEALSKIFSPQWENSLLDEGATSSTINIQFCFSWLVELESSASIRLVEWSFEYITWNYSHAHWYYHLKGEIPLMSLFSLAYDS